MTAWQVFFCSGRGLFEHRFGSLIASISKTSKLIDHETKAIDILQTEEWRKRELERSTRSDRRWESEQTQAVLKGSKSAKLTRNYFWNGSWDMRAKALATGSLVTTNSEHGWVGAEVIPSCGCMGNQDPVSSTAQDATAGSCFLANPMPAHQASRF